VHRDKPPRSERWEDKVWQGHQYNDRTVLKSGSYLRASCPFCHESLIRDGMIRLDTVNTAGEEGWVELSPYLNVFDHRSSVELSEGEEVGDMRCPNCGKSLTVPGASCERGDSHVACMMVGISTIEVPMWFCMRVGCHWHRIDPEDVHKIILDDSLEW
jgi:predicted RNA-binding Zn-ribbon protein involved in translation (DUF1610 family)